MRRSLRKLAAPEVESYRESDQRFTVTSLQEARQRLAEAGEDPAAFCFHSWMKHGVRYYRIWADQRMNHELVGAVPFGQVAARLKRAQAEKLFTVAKRHTPGSHDLVFQAADGLVQLRSRSAERAYTTFSLPVVGGDLVFLEGAEWSPRQAAAFVNGILVRGRSVAVAVAEANSLDKEA